MSSWGFSGFPGGHGAPREAPVSLGFADIIGADPDPLLAFPPAAQYEGVEYEVVTAPLVFESFAPVRTASRSSRPEHR